MRRTPEEIYALLPASTVFDDYRRRIPRQGRGGHADFDYDGQLQMIALTLHELGVTDLKDVAKHHTEIRSGVLGALGMLNEALRAAGHPQIV